MGHPTPVTLPGLGVSVSVSFLWMTGEWCNGDLRVWGVVKPGLGTGHHPPLAKWSHSEMRTPRLVSRELRPESESRPASRGSCVAIIHPCYTGHTGHQALLASIAARTSALQSTTLCSTGKSANGSFFRILDLICKLTRRIEKGLSSELLGL